MKILCSLTAAAAFAAFAAVGGSAHATTTTLDFTAPGISGSLQLTYGGATDAKYPSAGYELTGISGTFSDSNHGLNIVDAPVVELYTLTKTGPADPHNTGAPADLSSIDPSDPNSLLPPFSFGAVTYDNLYWPGGRPNLGVGCGRLAFLRRSARRLWRDVPNKRWHDQRSDL